MSGNVAETRGAGSANVDAENGFSEGPLRGGRGSAKTADMRRAEKPGHAPFPFARRRKRDLRRQAQKEKTLCAPREPQKVLVVELIVAPPGAPGALRQAPS